jgi:uncharacterized OB-fold protein
MFQTNFIQQGWECPKCKRVYSPTTIMCVACPQQTHATITTGTPPPLGNINSVTVMNHVVESDD